jgi:hypothetical protein
MAISPGIQIHNLSLEENKRIEPKSQTMINPRKFQFSLMTLFAVIVAFALGYWAGGYSAWYRPPAYQAHLDRLVQGNPGSLSAPATAREIHALQIQVNDRPDLKLVLPQQYLQFLKVTNGYQYDNFGFASSKEFVALNDRWKTSGTPAHFVVFGEDESRLYVLNQVSEQYHFLRWDDRQSQAIFSSFDEMLAELLRTCR